MYQTLNQEDYHFLSDEDKALLDRINLYAEKVMADIEPQKTRISEQLEKLKPIMEEIAKEKNVAPEDIFIKYMDLASLISAKKDEKFKNDFQDFDDLKI